MISVAALTFTLLSLGCNELVEAVDKPVVLFRLDDVQSWWCEDQSRAVIDNFLLQDVPINVGMIGEYLDQSSTIANYLQGLAGNPLVEFVSHSNKHQNFNGKTLQWQNDDLSTSNAMFESVTGVAHPKAFIPPFNDYSDNLFDALNTQEMTIISAECAWYPPSSPNAGTALYCPDGSDVVAPNIIVDGVYSLPCGAVMGGDAYWTDYHQPASFTLAMEWINEQIANQGFSVVMLHPVEFATDSSCGVMEPQKMSVLTQLLTYGKENWNMMTYQEAAYTLSNQNPPTHAPTLSPTPAPTRAPSVTQYPTSSGTKVGFRLDDVQSWWCEEPARAIMDLFSEESTAVNVGLIAGFLSEWSPMVPYLTAKVSDPLVELVSNSDTYMSYGGQTLAAQEADLAMSKTNLNTLLGTVPLSFIPPSDSYDSNTFTALKNQGLNTMSTRCMWNLESSAAGGTPVYCPAGSNSVAPTFTVDGVYSFPAGAVLGDMAYWEDSSSTPSLAGAVAWMEAQVANQGFSVLSLSPYEFSTDSTCTTVDTAKLEILRQVIQFAKGKYTVSTFQEMVESSTSAAPTSVPSAAPTRTQPPKSTLKLSDDFSSLTNWDKNLDGSSAACDIVTATGSEESHASCSLSYCESCFASQLKVTSDLRPTVMSSSSGVYWIGFRVRVPSSWTYDGASNKAVLLEVMPGDRASTQFPILALSLNAGTSFGVQICGSSTASTSTGTPVCTSTGDVHTLQKGVWSDWVVRLNMNHDVNGQGGVDVWVDGVSKLSSRPVLTSFNDISPPFVQVGVSNVEWDIPETPSFCPAAFSDGYVNGRCYRYVSTVETWNDAKATCEDKGGRLVSIPDKFTYDWLQRKFNSAKSKSFWLGYNDIATEGTWEWTGINSLTGITYYSNEWESGQPDNSGDCGFMYGPTGLMRDEKCTDKHEYVCEYDTTTTAAVEYNCPDKFKNGFYYNGFCYDWSDNAMTWNDAKAFCEANGGWLTSLQDEDTFHWVAETFKGRERYYFIGLNDIVQEKTWVWDNGDTDGYIPWDRSEPDSRNYWDCAVLYKTQKLRDMDCRRKVKFVCQTAATPPPPPITISPTPADYKMDISALRIGDSGSCFNEVSTSSSTPTRDCVSTFSLGATDNSEDTSKSSSGNDSDSASQGSLYLGLLVTCLVLIAAMMVLVVVMFARQSSAIEAAVRVQSASGRELLRKPSKSKGYDELMVDNEVEPLQVERSKGSRFIHESPMKSNQMKHQSQFSDPHAV